MKRLITASAFAAIAMSAMAQTAPPTPAPAPVAPAKVEPAPALSSTTKIALNALKDRYTQAQTQINEIQQEVTAVATDFANANPGWHLDFQTWQPVKNVDPAKAPTPAAPAKPTEKK